MSDNTYTRCNIELNIDFNKPFDAWGNFCIVAGWWGMLFEVLASGTFVHISSNLNLNLAVLELTNLLNKLKDT